MRDGTNTEKIVLNSVVKTNVGGVGVNHDDPWPGVGDELITPFGRRLTGSLLRRQG